MNYFRQIILAFLLFILFSTDVIGQPLDLNIDSLKKELKKTTLDDTTRIQLKFTIGNHLRLFRNGYWDTLIRECTQIISTHKDRKSQLASEKVLTTSLINRGLLFKFEGNFPKALEYYYKGLKIANKIGDKSAQAYCYNNIGRVHVDLGDEKLALKYYKLSLDLKIEINNLSGIAESYNNMGVIYDNQGQKEKAIHYYKKCLKIHEELGDKAGEAYTCNNLGVIYQKSDPKLALDYLLRSLTLRKELEDEQGIAHVYTNLGKYYSAQKEYDKALAYHMDGLRISQELGYPYLIQIHAQELSKILEIKGNDKDAFNMYRLYIQMRDSLNNESTQKASIQQQANYEYEKQKALDDAAYEKQISLEHEAKKKQTILTYATTGGVALLGIFLLIVFNRLKITRKQNAIIEKQKEEVETQKLVVEKAHKELRFKSKEITDSIQYAKRIQNAILPHKKELNEHLKDSFVLYKPKDIVAGDFYWLEQIGDQTLFAVADCTGHGVPGAMVSVVCNNGLNRSVREYGLTDPGQILDKTREIVVQEFEKSEDDVKDGMDIALCSLSSVDSKSGSYRQLKFAGAHNPLWIIRAVPSSADEGDNTSKIIPTSHSSADEGGNTSKIIPTSHSSADEGGVSRRAYELIELKADKQPIGQFDDPKPFRTHTVELQKGDTFYIFSDGYADQFGGEQGKKLKTANFKKLLLNLQNESMQRQQELINDAFEEWKGNLEQLDDVCIIGVKI